MYEKLNYDELLPTAVRKELMQNLQKTWLKRTNGNAIFLSAVKKTNIDGFKMKLTKMVKQLNKERYPYKTDYY